jgi:hypothetical protein
MSDKIEKEKLKAEKEEEKGNYTKAAEQYYKITQEIGVDANTASIFFDKSLDNFIKGRSKAKDEIKEKDIKKIDEKILQLGFDWYQQFPHYSEEQKSKICNDLSSHIETAIPTVKTEKKKVEFFAESMILLGKINQTLANDVFVQHFSEGAETKLSLFEERLDNKIKGHEDKKFIEAESYWNSANEILREINKPEPLLKSAVNEVKLHIKYGRHEDLIRCLEKFSL